MDTFFGPGSSDQSGSRRNVSAAMLHKMGCKMCPLASLSNRHPNMPATGADHPLIYVLGEAPGKDEDEENRQFVGVSGQFLHRFIPRKYRDKIRYNNVVRTRPYKNETPNWMAVEACRPSVQRDIEETKPKVILGFGNLPLNWVSGFSGITMWRGRRMPVKIGSHTCWYYPMFHPAYILRQGRSSSAEEQVFKFDMRRVFSDLEVLDKPVVHTPEMVWSGIKIITEGGSKGLRQLEEAIDWAIEQPGIGFDYETNALRPYSDDNKILTAAFATTTKGFAFPVEHSESQWKKSELGYVYAQLERFFKKARGRKYVHNLSFELEWTGVKLSRKLLRMGRWEDTATQAAIIDERRGERKPGCFSLEFLCQQYFGFNLKKLSNVDRKRLDKTPLETVLLYNGADAKYHCSLGKQQRLIILDQGLSEPYRLALRRVPTLVLSQIKGIPVDQEEVETLAKKYRKRIRVASKRLMALPVIKKFVKLKNRIFKPGSPPDVLVVLRDILKRPECKTIDKYTKAEKYTTDEEVLKKIDHPFCTHLLATRKASKRMSTYIEPYLWDSPVSVIHDDGLVHPVFNSYFAETGRLSAEEPNIQNVPKRDQEAREVRKPMKAPKGCVIGGFDFGQIEARIIAVMARDKVYIKALWEDFDVHMDWAQRIAHAYPARIGGRKMLKDKKAMKDFRTDIKSEWTFPLFFGTSLASAAGYLHIPEDVLAPLYDQFWDVFHGVKTWQEELLAFEREHGYVETLTGRRRRSPMSSNQIINSPVQGTAAEIVMQAMCALSETGDWRLQPEINIHDDLTFMRLPINQLDELAHKIVGTMLTLPFKWAKVVPWTVECSIGEDWLDMEEIGTFSSQTFFNGSSK